MRIVMVSLRKSLDLVGEMKEELICFPLPSQRRTSIGMIIPKETKTLQTTLTQTCLKTTVTQIECVMWLTHPVIAYRGAFMRESKIYA